MARKAAAVKKNAKPIETAGELKNSLTDVLNGLTGGYGLGGLYGTAFGSTQVSQVDTFLKNSRWYLISNMRQVLNEIYVEHGLIETLVNVPVEDAFSKGVEIKSEQLDTDQVKELLVYIERNKVLLNFMQALKWSRLFGGGALLVITDDDPKEELDAEALGEDSRLYFRPVDMWELYFGATNIDSNDPGQIIKEPEFYNYYGHKIHKSRVIRFEGKPAPSLIRPKLRGWGYSVVESVVRSINQYLKSIGLTFEVMDEFKVDVYGIDGFNNALTTAGGSDKIIDRVQKSNFLKNYQHALVKDVKDTFESKHLTFSGISDIIREIRIQLASDLRIPPIKLFGVAGSNTGLSNTSEAEMEVYANMLDSEIRAKVKYDLLRVLEICCQNLFGMTPDDLEIEFKPIKELSAEQQENIKNQKFQRITTAVQAGLITPKEAKEAINKDNLLPVPINEDDELFKADKPAEEAIEKDAQGKKAGPAKEKQNAKPWWKRIFSNDADFEAKHKRRPNGEFGEGGAHKFKQKRAAVKDALEKISKGSEEEVIKDLRDDLEQYGGSNDVALKWGKNDERNKGYGLKHIGEKHGEEAVRGVLEALVSGEVSRFVEGNKTVHVEKDGYRAILSLDEHGKKKTWLLTGYEIDEDVKKETVENGEVSTHSVSTQHKPTFSRLVLGAVSKAMA